VVEAQETIEAAGADVLRVYGIVVQQALALIAGTGAVIELAEDSGAVVWAAAGAAALLRFDGGAGQRVDPAVAERQAAQSRLRVPLPHPSGGQVTLEVYHPAPDRFDADDRSLLSLLAAFAGNALHRAKLETQQQATLDALRECQALKEQIAVNERLATVGRLAAGVAHEINNPLAFVGSNVEFVRTALHEEVVSAIPDELRMEIQDALQEAYGGVLRIRDIVRELLALARPDLDTAEMDLDAVVGDAVRIAGPRVGAVPVELELGAAPRVRGSANKLGQVVMNLVVNAAHAIGLTEGGLIRVRTRASETQGVIEVEDNGPGIAPEHLERIFEPFFTTKRAGAGTGLGLAISQGIVTSLGGKLEVRSTVKVGTVFTITLPLKSAPVAPPQGV
jgi:signal transduction histidine kinase